MFVTPDGISMLVNPLQPANALFPILVTLDGISMLVNPLQPSNALFPIFVTLDGIFMLPFFPIGTVIITFTSLSYNIPAFDE